MLPGGVRGGRRGGDADLPGKCPPGSRNLVQVRGQVFMPPSYGGGICRKMGDDGHGSSEGAEGESWKAGSWACRPGRGSEVSYAGVKGVGGERE